jgi:hypothetical protein
MVNKRRDLKCEYLTSRVQKYNNPLVAEGEDIFTTKQNFIICDAALLLCVYVLEGLA